MPDQVTLGDRVVPEPFSRFRDDLIPARRINDYVYCPRRCHLEWVQSEWADSVDTVEGRALHRRVDVQGPLLPDPDDLAAEDPPPVLHARSVTMSDEEHGIIARMDLVEAEGLDATPVDYKHGKKPECGDGVWDPDRYQLGAQALCLRANGYRCQQAVVYYSGSKERVQMPITEALLQDVVRIAGEIRRMAARDTPPPPLSDSPKCAGCSLVGICLPDEVNFLSPGLTVVGPQPDDVRRLYPILSDGLPVYCQEQGAFVGKKDECLVIKQKGQVLCEVPLIQVSQLAVFGGVQVSSQALAELSSRGIPVCYFTTGGWFHAITQGLGSRNVLLRRFQFQRAEDPVFCLSFARRVVEAKIRNQRTMLRRNGDGVPDSVLDRMSRLAAESAEASSIDSLLGIEGMAARLYFQHFPSMLRPRGGDGERLAFDLEGRNRRPPRDPVNAMLSLCYSILAKDCGVTLAAVGFDPFLGFYHTAHHGRQSLALDLMEEFRPILADSTVISVINNGEVKSEDFVRAAGSVALKPGARRRLIEAYERRLEQVITHPVFGYQVSYRKLLEVQARLLARYVTGETREFPAILPR
ncbi:CRISPR-associated endonuclease Cas1 [Myxococcota bacterium]|nr:CRISPR-associated endonuclease Cas1 [Myxococcota bacterium]